MSEQIKEVMKEVAIKQENLENNILNLINEFEEDTGMSVRDITLVKDEKNPSVIVVSTLGE